MTTITARRFDTLQPIRITLRHGRIVSVVPLDMPPHECRELPLVGPGLRYPAQRIQRHLVQQRNADNGRGRNSDPLVS